MKKTWVLFFILVVLLFTGCSSVQVLLKEKTEKVSLYYGYIGFEENGPVLTQFSLKRLDGDQSAPFYNCGRYRGVYFTYIPNGTYRIDKIAATQYGGNVTTTYNYSMPAQGNGFEIKKPSLYYNGSLRIKNKTRMFSSEFDYDVEKADWPTEEQVLERLLDIVEPGSETEKLITTRLLQYRKMSSK